MSGSAPDGPSGPDDRRWGSRTGDPRRAHFDRVLGFFLGHPRLSMVVALLLAGLGASRGSEIPLRLSVIELLPKNEPAVLDFQAVLDEVGGVGYLGVLVGPVEAPETYLPPIKKYLSSRPDIRYAFDEREKYLLDDRALYLFPREELDQLLENADLLLFGGRTGGLLDLGLDTPEERAENLTKARAFFETLKQKHGLGAEGVDRRFERYFLSQDGRYAMLFAKPAFDSEDLGRATVLVEDVRRELRELVPAGVPVELWGRYVNQVNDTLQIRHDIAVTSGVGLALIALVLVLGLSSARSALFTVGAVVVSLGWTVGFVRVAVQQINIVTGFLLAILGGLGVEYGIHLIRRFQQERDEGHSRTEALEASYFHVGRALLSAALTSAGAFIILTFSNFRGFSELGLIAGFGVLAVYAVYVLTFPAGATFIPDRPTRAGIRAAFGWYPFTLRSGWLLLPLTVVAIFGLRRAELDLSVDRLREVSSRSVALNRFVNELYGGRSTTPAAILARTREEATAVERVLHEPRFASVVTDAVALSRLVPDDQEERSELLAPYRKRVEHLDDATLRDKLGMDPTRIRSWLAARPISADALPESLRSPFGPRGNVVLVYPAKHLGEIGPMRAFTNVLLEVKSHFPDVKLGTDAVILVQIVDYVLHDGRIVLAVFLLGSFFVLAFDFRSALEAAKLEAQLCLGMLLLVALMGAFGQPFTMLNVAMIPAVVAAGIDMGVHVRHRELEVEVEVAGAGPQSSIEAARFVAHAVQLGALTTLIGFGALFFAQVSMLRGIAWVSCLGQLSMYLVCMFIWPVGKDFLAAHPRRRPRVRASQGRER